MCWSDADQGPATLPMAGSSISRASFHCDSWRRAVYQTARQALRRLSADVQVALAKASPEERARMRADQNSNIGSRAKSRYHTVRVGEFALIEIGEMGALRGTWPCLGANVGAYLAVIPMFGSAAKPRSS